MHGASPDPSRSRTTDSWIEIPSRPSNSSLSSAADEIVTTGLRVQRDPLSRRRRRTANGNSPLSLNIANGPPSVGDSSQDEYEESESESDRVMSSSNEDIGQQESRNSPAQEGGDDEPAEDDDEKTALGVQTDPQCFTPQPNAFTHPPSSQNRHRASVPGSYFPDAGSSAQASQRHSYPGRQRQRQRPSHSPYNVMSPSHQADHDAALRASLSTLLSCAAAARGLSRKSDGAEAGPSTMRPSQGSTRVDPTTLRMVPESVALGEQQQDPSPPQGTRRLSSTESSSDPQPSDSPASPGHQQDKGKRKAGRSTSKDQRLVKKPRRAVGTMDETISPTLFTWVVSAGVLVLVSALSFSAGYSLGKETGRMEAGSASWGVGSEEAAGCAREAGRSGIGIRRLRWGAGASAVRA